MIKHIALCGVAALSLSASNAPAQQADPHAGHSTSHASAAGSARPHFGEWGFDVAGMDRKVNPGDNFFDYANGTWARTTRPMTVAVAGSSETSSA